MQVRDQLSNAVVEDIPESDVGLEHQLALKESRGDLGAQFKDKDAIEDENLTRLTRTTPYYKVRAFATRACASTCTCTCSSVALRSEQASRPCALTSSLVTLPAKLICTRHLSWHSAFVPMALPWSPVSCTHPPRAGMQRNRAQLCSFFARGECTRGAECPYRHEMPLTGELAEQNIRDRYYGINDPVAHKMMRRLGERVKLEPPEDPEIKTLYVGNIEQNWKEDDLREVFEKHGDVTAVRVVHAKSCAFVTFSTRQARSAVFAQPNLSFDGA